MATNAAHPVLISSAIARKHQTGALAKKTEKLQSPSDAAAQPATVNLSNGKLTVEANNSDLTQILHDVADISGMAINGLSKGLRVFGVYGPGNSREVLTDLLVGSGYNFVMVGGATDGPPSALLLTSQNSNAPSFTPANPGPAASTDRDESEQPESEMNPSGPDALGPGAISPAPSQNDLDDNTRAQRTLQRLQHQQEQQQQNAPQ